MRISRGDQAGRSQARVSSAIQSARAACASRICVIWRSVNGFCSTGSSSILRVIVVAKTDLLELRRDPPKSDFVGTSLDLSRRPAAPCSLTINSGRDDGPAAVAHRLGPMIRFGGGDHPKKTRASSYSSGLTSLSFAGGLAERHPDHVLASQRHHATETSLRHRR